MSNRSVLPLEKLRVVFFKENDIHVARCLELNTGTQAPTLEKLYDRLYMTILMDVLFSKGPETVTPGRYFKMWDEGKDIKMDWEDDFNAFPIHIRTWVPTDAVD